MPSVQFPHNTWDSSLHPRNGPQLSQWCSYIIIKLVNLTEHCAVTNSWLKDMQYASSKCSVGSHCTLRGQWLGVHSALGVTHPFDTRPLFYMHVDQNFQEIGPPAPGTGGPIFLGLCGPPDQSFCQTKTSMTDHYSTRRPQFSFIRLSYHLGN